MKKVFELKHKEIDMISGGFFTANGGHLVGEFVGGILGLYGCLWVMEKDHITPRGYDLVKLVYCSIILLTSSTSAGKIGWFLGKLNEEAATATKEKKRKNNK